MKSLFLIKIANSRIITFIMEYILRDATPEDREWVDALTEKTMGTYIRASWQTEEKYQHYLRLNSFNLESTKIIIADGKRAGRLSISRKEQVLHLDNLHLETDFHGRGIGSRVIIDTIETACSEGRVLELKCLKTNPVQSLYTRLGFSLIKEDEKRLYYRIK
jgi:ribosomal protein S18 acetylase RimI-like enzyme